MPVRTTNRLPLTILPIAKPIVCHGLVIEPVPVASLPAVATKMALAVTKLATTEQGPVIELVVYVVLTRVPPQVPPTKAIKPLLGVIVKIAVAP